ncbi:MAG: TonB-dependent receptor [Flavipsychrobacter sp.]|jgi:outer membrane receptor protein involved in Fe transport|nr:TonB-dependent receptor [Flavipsychrobacter sp.]
MQISRRLLLLILFMCGMAKAYSQTGKPTSGSVSGKVTDAKNNAVGYATVTLLKMDSAVVNGDLTKEDGTFSISPTGTGSFLLRIESIGFTKKIISIEVPENDQDKRLGKIKLSEAENALKEVSITGEKNVMELRVDKKVFNVDKNITTAGGSATDVLQNVPAVSVGADGTVSLRGKSDVTILIDGKPSTLLGSDVTSALQSLPAGSIESVEVITNPSAKYDAQGTTGIINIITKKDARLGLNGSVTLGAGTNEKYNGNLGLNLRKGKWNTFLNSSFRLNNTYNNITTDRKDKDAAERNYLTTEHSPRNFDGFFNTIGVTYDPDKYNSITITENINKMMFGYRDYSHYYVMDSPTTLSHQDRYTDFGAYLFSFSSAIDYKHKFKKKDEELNIDGTFAHTDFTRKQYFRTIDSPVASRGDTTISNAPANGWNNSLNIWADYTNPLFTKNGKLGLGFKSQLYWFSSHCDEPTLEYKNDTFDIIRVDSGLLTSFDYIQQIHAAYVNWSDQVGKFSYQAGLRFEDAIYDGTARIPRDTSFHNSFANFFPSAFVSYQLANQQSVYLNYSRRVNRPHFMQMLPFKDYSNPGTVSMGNPNLIPEFVNAFEFSYNRSDNKGNNIILSAYYNQTANITQRVPRIITAKDSTIGLINDTTKLLSQPVNITSGATYGLEATGHLQFTSFWDATINLNFFQNDLKIGNIDTAYRRYMTDNSGYSYFGKVNTTVKLPKNFSVQVNANYESPKVIAQGNLKESYWVDVAIKKNILKNKATITLNCSDVFNTRVFVTYYHLTSYSGTINREKETRILNLSFNYRFGKQDLGKSPAKGPKPEKPTEKKNRIEKPSGEDREKNLKDNDGDDQGGGGGQGGGQRRQG